MHDLPIVYNHELYGFHLFDHFNFHNLQTKEREDKEQGQQHGNNEQSKPASTGTRQKGCTDGQDNGKGHHEASTTLPVRDRNCDAWQVATLSCRYSNIIF
jgi:hypothetical protein